MPHVEVLTLGAGDVALARRAFTLLAVVFDERADGDAGPDDAYLADLLARKGFHALVAVGAGEPVGCLTAHTLPMTRASASELFVYDLAVRPDHQRQGVGRRLVDAALALAWSLGAESVFVPADDADQDALAFYRAVGGQGDPVTMFTFSRPHRTPP